MELNWEIIEFKDLSAEDVYDILELRSEVFIVEQTCVYQDIDRKDKDAIHVIGRNSEHIVAYSRILPAAEENYAIIGRVIIKEIHRNKKLGDLLMTKTLEACNKLFKNEPLQMNAQKHLEKYYNKHKFIKEGDPFLEDGIPHIRMTKK